MSVKANPRDRLTGAASLGMVWKGERAGDGIRTHDNNVGNVVLYQLSYTRKPCSCFPGESENVPKL